MCIFAPFYEISIMNRYIYRSLLFLFSIVLSACSSESETEVSSDCYISYFALGTLTRTVTASDGSTSVVSYNGSYYPMNINQITGEMSNPIPLQTKTDLSSVTASVTATGLVTYYTSDGEETYYSTSSYIDFRNPVKFRVYATDNSGYRDYTVTVKMRDKEKGSYDWETLDGVVLTGKQERVTLPWNNGVLLVSADASSNIYAAQLTGEAWSTDTPCTGTAGILLEGLRKFAGKLWSNTATGILLFSTDGVAWTPVAQDHAGDEVTLVAASSDYLYARLHNAADDPADRLARSTDGSHWTTESVDQSLSLFPTIFSSVCYTLNGAPYVLVAGKTTDGRVTVWKKDEKNDEGWVLMSETGSGELLLPWEDKMSLVYYKKNLIAMKSQQDTTFISKDNGLTWKKNSNLVMPVKGQPFSATSQGDYLYLFAGDKAYRAKINE